MSARKYPQRQQRSAQQQTAPSALICETMWSGQGAGAHRQNRAVQHQHNSCDNDDACITSDVFGHAAYLDGFASEDHVNLAMAEMQASLAAIPATEKVALVEVHRSNPQLLNDDHVLQFLWAENFNAPAAARRMVRYWNDRYKLFRPEKFCMPMTLKGALKDDELAMNRGYFQLLPETDTAGRAIIYIDWSSHEPSLGYTEESMHRVFWYMMHVAIEDVSVLQRGVVILIYPQEARLDQFDQSLWNSIAEFCKNSLPLRWKSTHIVHPNRFFSIIHPVFMSSLPEDVQVRVVVHSGTKMKVLANLLRYCLPWDRIPSDIGGCIDLDFKKWLAERMEKEDKASCQKPPAHSSSNLMFGAALQQEEGTSSGALSPQLMIRSNSVPDQATSGHDIADDIKSGERHHKSLEQRGSKCKSKGKPSTAEGPNVIIKRGRKSDPRMDRAVQAKLDDPSLPLLDALRLGGFIFPELDCSILQYSLQDNDNVKLTQRKNQLLRRIRSSKRHVG